ncbi:MAG: glycerol-3-phosphate dehydrogenase/oxidase [Gemmatimonadaceae bacterium]|nr:glycerol-3-phosphate dehydrogenase/oxidase [Gemmatimonadaceae bacterium]
MTVPAPRLRSTPAVGLPRRETAWAALADARVDLLVVGGGITGAGIARDAAMRGLTVALVERDDWASGTSSRSSRLVHGGVRYLEHGHLHLVFEASRERRTLLRLAPHLVRPLRFTWPVYAGARVPRWKLRAGLALYDALALFRNVGRARGLSARSVLAAEPALRREGLVGGAQYWDAGTDDARLTLATVVAAHEAGAVVLNHAALVAIDHGGDGRVRAVALRDESTGDTCTLAVRAIVNATGPWSDATRTLDDGVRHAAVLGSKGVHIAVPRERAAVRGAVTIIHPDDQRVLFLLPSPVHTLIGTTETPADAPPDTVRADAGDIAYLLRAANHHLPDAALAPDDVVAAWAGLRPLVAPRAGTSANDASREHHIAAVAPSGLVSVTGGKLTTYRAMAAEVVDAVERVLGRARVTASPTADVPLPGSDDTPPAAMAAAAVAAGAAPDVAAHLVRAHGARWRLVWGLVDRERPLGERLDPALPYLRADVFWGAAAEGAWTVADVLVRRIPVAFERRDAGRALAPLVADLLARVHGWDDDTRRGAIARYDDDVGRVITR